MSNTVEYFPHICKPGKTIAILQNKFGNDGVLAMFRVLEFLGASENHTADLSDHGEFEYFVSYLHVSDETATAILDELARMEFIDRELWQQKVLWCQKLVNNVTDVYKNRKREPPQKPILSRNNGITTVVIPDLGVEIPQRKVKESKEKESKEKETEKPLPPLVESWNLIADKFGLSKILKVTERRETGMRCREREKEFDFTAIAKEIEASDFLRGDNNRGWKVDFDFVFCSRNNYVKILEGKYRNSQPVKSLKTKEEQNAEALALIAAERKRKEAIRAQRD